ncbi:MAG: acyl carrier protein [Gemmatimonadota bacterium]
MPALRQLVADVFRVDPDAVGPADSPETIPAWDSLQHFALVLELEERFGIQLETEEIEKLTTVGDIQRLLDVRGVGSAGEGGAA